MSLTDLAKKLRLEAETGSISITASNLTLNTGLVLRPGFDLDATIRDSFRLEQSWTVAVTSQDIKDPVGNTMRIENGKSSFPGLQLADKAVTIEFSVADVAGQSILNFTAPVNLDGWKFSDTFTYMTGFPYDYVPYTNPYFIFSTDKLAVYSWTGKTIALETGQNFASLITLTGVLQGIVQFLTGFNTDIQLPFYGPTNVKDINKAPNLLPQFAWTAPIIASLQPILSLQIKNPFVGMRVANAEVTEDGEKVVHQLRNFYFGMKLAI